MSPTLRPNRIEKKPLKPLTRWDTAEVATLYSNAEKEEGKPLTVHKEVACYYSPVFKAAFNSKFKEGETQTYHLEGTSRKLVQTVIYWMYTQELDITSQVTRATKGKIDMGLCELWVLGDRLFIPSLQNLVVRELERLRNKLSRTCTCCLQYVYDNTAPGSALRKLFVSQCAFNVASTRFLDRPEHFPPEMLLDLVTALSSSVPEDVKTKHGTKRDMSEYDVGFEDEGILELD